MVHNVVGFLAEKAPLLMHAHETVRMGLVAHNVVGRSKVLHVLVQATTVGQEQGWAR